LREGKALGSEEEKGLGIELCHEQRRELPRGSAAYERLFPILTLEGLR
jgi:hypothetical protein